MADLPVRVPARELAFSKRLVRVREDSGARRRVEKTLYQFVSAQRFGLSSDEGEPVEFTVQTGLIGVYANKPAARYTIRDAEERTVAEGRIPLDYARHTITQAVPGAGVYYLDFNDSGAGFQLTVPEGRAATLMLVEKCKAPSLGTLDRFYFYVPKHTPTIEYFWAGGPHVVRGPDGTLVRAVDTRDDWVTVPVPAGGDGKIWYLQSLRTSVLKFITVPNNVATASDALLVPEDVARADGLEVKSPRR
jgi:hypothetical protein